MPAVRSTQNDPQLNPTPRLTEDGHGGRMGFLEHLDELRQRVFRAFAGVVVGTILGMLVAEPVLRYLGSPYLSLREDSEFLIFDPTGTVVAYFRVALLVGLTMAVPIVTYQLVMFVVPAMTSKERRFFMSALPAVFGLFLTGILFAWFILIPPALRFLAGFQDSLFRTEWEASRYINFVTTLLFWMGVAFETPLVLFVLSLIGFVTAGPLLKNWRIAVVVAAVAAALITPTIDPVNMFLVMGPLMVLYLISIILVFIGARIYRRNTDIEKASSKQSK